ncbi:hypothetical protein CFC21_087361 [Triticum aestivum]|uniref:Ubiquitin-like protease family profile domain-containing protein n=2 Tax=Triticum aestivum TaxID=4565 RepID=A0A9R1LAF2_WHEAT|nr:hypothetical protein CFC21_087361 [Triticum aestivum]
MVFAVVGGARQMGAASPERLQIEAEWLVVIIKMMMMISWIHHSRIGQLDGEKRAMRASQERLTTLTDRFTDDQKGAAAEMGMQAVINVRCVNLVDPVCDWLGEIYDPASREFVIPGRGRLPLNEESVFCTLGVPRGHIKVPYEVNNEIEEALFPRLFPGLESMPNTSVLADSLQAMTTHGDVFKMKLLMYLISAVFAPTTSLRPSNKCFPILAELKNVKNMNWCKFIADFLHDAFSSKMYQKGCRLHLMLMYVDCLDLSIVDFTGTGDPPPTHKFAVSPWAINAVKAVLATNRVTNTKYGKLQLMAKHAIDYNVFGGPQNFGKWMDVHSAPSCPTEARAPVEHLIRQFASGMTGLLGKLVEGWTSLSGSDNDAVARQFTSFVLERTHRPTGWRGRYDYNSSQELAGTQDELDGDAGLSKDDDDDMENVQQDTDDDKHAEVRAGGNKGKDAPDVPPPEKVKEYMTARGEGVFPSKRGRALEDVGQGSPGKRVKKTTTRGAKHISKDLLKRLHSKLSTGGNSDVHEALGDKTATAPSTAPTNSDASGQPSPPVADVQARTTGIHTSGSDESLYARTAEILPTLLAMKDAAVSHAIPSASVEVDAPEANLSKENSHSSDTDSKRVRGGTPVSTTEVAEAAVHNDMPSIGESLGTTAPAPPRKQSIVIPNAPAVARSSRDESGYVPVSTLFPPPAKRNVMEKPEDWSTTDAGVKPGTSDVGERPEQTAPLPAVEIPSLNLRTSRLPVNLGVPYSPNKKIIKKAAADTADNTPRPTNKPDHSVAADSDMFVDLSPLDSAPQVVRGPASRHERHPMAFTPPSFSLGISQDQPVVPDPMPVVFAFPGGMPAMMAQPMVEGRKAVKFAEPIVQATPEEISPSLDEAYRRIEEAALQRRSSRWQGQSSSNVPANTVSEDTIRSATPGSVRTKVIQYEATYVDLGDLAESMRPNGKMSTNVVACGIDYINNHTDVCADKIIMHYSVTCKIWDGDFHHKIPRKNFAQHGEFKLTLKKYVMFPMFQELAPHDPNDKCGHHYAICLDLKNQRFEVLDSMCSTPDADLTSHAEFFINNVKETWNRHYENSKVQIRHFPVEYVATTNQGNTTDCGFHTLKYFAKWEGRLVPAVTAATVVKLRKIYTWNWLTNEDFNKRSGLCEFVEEPVKKVIKKYK